MPARRQPPRQIVPAVITIYEDRTFSLVTKTTSALLRRAAGFTNGARRPNGGPATSPNR